MTTQPAPLPDKKPLVPLYFAAGFGLIIPYPTGVVYSNQAGGYACSRPELEGVYVPLDIKSDAGMTDGFMKELLHYFLEGPKWEGRCDDGIDDETADYLDGLFDRHPTIRNLKMRVDRSKWVKCMEAWIHVTFTPADARYFTVPGTSGILTWPNSD